MKVKVLASALSIAAALAAPALALAQSNSALTRAQVRNDLVQIEKTGYRPGDGDQSTYPQQVQQAEAREARSTAASSGFGGVAAGTSQSGQTLAAPRADVPGLRPIYFGQ